MLHKCRTCTNAGLTPCLEIDEDEDWYANGNRKRAKQSHNNLGRGNRENKKKYGGLPKCRLNPQGDD